MILNINTDISGRQAGEQYSHTLLQALQNGEHVTININAFATDSFLKGLFWNVFENYKRWCEFSEQITFNGNEWQQKNFAQNMLILEAIHNEK